MASLRLVRHATLLLELGGTTFLVDPQLDPSGARPPIPGTPNPVRNPLVELPPEPPASFVAAAGAVLQTHLHEDHLDATAVALLLEAQPPVLCQPEDVAALEERGLRDVRAVEHAAEHAGVTVTRTGGRHGREPEWADRLAPVSGYVLRAPGEPTTYVAGDTVWCDEVEAALAEHRPDVVVVNAGAARFEGSDVITMDAADVRRVAEAAPAALVVAVHLEAINHCLETRAQLRAALEGLSVDAPVDGARLTFG